MTLLTLGQAMKVTQINTVGYFQENIGQAKMIDHYHRFFFYVNLTSFQSSYYRLIANAVVLEHKTAEDQLLHNLYRQLWSQCFEIEEYLQKLGHNRNKRALLNILGKSIKFITGNLDEDDLNEINKNLEKLYNNQKDSLEKITKLTSFANHITDRYATDIETLNNNSLVIQELIKNVTENSETQLLLLDEIYTSSKLKDTLQMLERTISLAFQDITSIELFSTKDLKQIMRYLTQNYLKEQLLSVTDKHLFKILQFSKLHLMAVNDTITFLLKIPILSLEDFKYSKIYPIPNQKSQIIIPPTSYHLETTTMQELWTDEDCSTIEEQIICSMKAKTDKCNLKDLNDCTVALVNEMYQVHVILRNNEILISTDYPIEIIENCDNYVERKNLKGTYIIRSNCKIIFDKVIISNKFLNFSINAPTVEEQTLQEVGNVKLKLEHLNNINLLKNDVKNLNNQEVELSPIIHAIHFSITSMCMIIVFIGLCILFVFRKKFYNVCFKKRTIIKIQASKLPKEEEERPIEEQEMRLYPSLVTEDVHA